MPLCQQCGSKTVEEDLFCENCGMNLKKEEINIKKICNFTEITPEKRTSLKLIIFVLFIVGIVAVLASQYSTKSEQLPSKPVSSAKAPAPPITERELIIDKAILVPPGKVTNISFKMPSIAEHEKNLRLLVNVWSIESYCDGAKLRLFKGNNLIETSESVEFFNRNINDPGLETYTLSFEGGKEYLEIEPKILIRCSESKFSVSVTKNYEVAAN